MRCAEIEDIGRGRVERVLPVFASDGRAAWRVTYRTGAFVGCGEAAPMPAYFESWARHDSVVAAKDSPATALRALLRGDAGAMESPSARCALATAVLDCRGLVEQRPLRDLLGFSAVPSTSKLPLSQLVDSVATLEEALSAGFRHFKVKLGRGVHAEEVKTLREIVSLLEALGLPGSLRIDANRRLDQGTLADFSSSLTSPVLDYVEEPLPTLPASISAATQYGFFLGLDESLHEGGLDVSHRCIRAWVLKPMTLGGPCDALALATRALARGVLPVVSHFFDGAVSFAAAAELSLAVASRCEAAGVPSPAPGLALPHTLRPTPPPQFVGAAIVATNVFGHGIRVENDV